VVVLIHGGAWFSGPNPGEVIGFPFNFSTNNSESLVKDLMNNGYTVVSVLYRLMKLGTTNTEIESNGDKLSEMLDDIEDAIEHFRERMSSEECLFEENYTKFHILGESAGGHLALMYAYTRADPMYVKSVTSLYAPTNIVQFYNWINNPGSTNIYACSTTYTPANVTAGFRCVNLYAEATPKHMPFNWMFDTITSGTNFNFFSTICITTNPNQKVYPGSNLIKGLVGKTNPTTTELESISPVHQNNIGNIPTFIMHGNNDFIVPYNQSSQDLSTKLTLNGDLEIQNPVCQLTSMPVMDPLKRHLIRRYDGVTHGFEVGNINPSFRTAMFNRARTDILYWISVH